MSLLEAPDAKTISRALVFHAILCDIGGAYSVLLPYDPSLTLSQCTLAGPVYTGMPLVDPVYTGIPLGDSASTCRVHWNTTGKT